METTNGETKPTEATPPTPNGHTANGQQEAAHYQLPDAGTLKEVGEFLIKDENGKEIQFKSLYEDKPGRQLVVFIRHFYCGVRSRPSPIIHLLTHDVCNSTAKNLSVSLPKNCHPQPSPQQLQQHHSQLSAVETHPASQTTALAR